MLSRAKVLALGAMMALAAGGSLMVRAGSSNAPAQAASSAALAEDLEVVRKARILFLHQSVGIDILDGMAKLDAEVPGAARLNVVSANQAPAGSTPAMIESADGENMKPDTKIAAFATLLGGQGPANVDLALMKFCYVDFNPRTDVKALFARYRSMIEGVRAKSPATRIAHVTVPLTVYPTEIKWRFYRVIGKEVWEDETNARRAEFNALLKQTFRSDPIFDLATAEATRPDGKVARFTLRGQEYPVLATVYTEDGGHLNDTGKRVIGAAAIRFLSAALRAKPGQ